jgi:hypothetical protein
MAGVRHDEGGAAARARNGEGGAPQAADAGGAADPRTPAPTDALGTGGARPPLPAPGSARDGGGAARPRWQVWAPWGAALWSLGYAALGLFWAATGDGFPFAPERVDPVVGPVVGRLGPAAAWAVVAAAGLPAALLALAVARGARAARPVAVAAGAGLSGVLLLLMTDVGLLTVVGYTPYGIVGLITGADVGALYLAALSDPALWHQVLCLAGGFLWALTALAHLRRRPGTCAHCGRTGHGRGWTEPAAAARWGRVAVALAVVVPVLYAATRFAWLAGIPLGISEEFLREGAEQGMWTSGSFLAAFGLGGAVLTLGLIQRWGEVFPRWMVGLAGRRVPVALAVVPASAVAVLLFVGGIAMVSGYAQLVGEQVAGAGAGMTLLGHLPTSLFPLWGAALGAATLAYHYRRRPSCAACGRGPAAA